MAVKHDQEEYKNTFNEITNNRKFWSFLIITVFPCSIMQRHNLEHIIGAGAILNLAHVKFNLTCVACAKTVFRVVAMHYIQGLDKIRPFYNEIPNKVKIK
ncbi:hypothetical protein BpHYR1_037049 [Brachionus plicatilis]|uniref:Uncharacterized protein n=1 Tax=Brachionus plicatilis TaxID=10195 RepID=A0A3M7SML6_BRAPC|nr:hypothetical protein BpHYR1_037049 [Brachionus plicatilis]